MARLRPVTASDGIHDNDVTDDSTRMTDLLDGVLPLNVVIEQDGNDWAPRHGAGRCHGRGCQHTSGVGAPSLVAGAGSGSNRGVADPIITVFLADDSLLVREGVRALLNLQPDLEVVGVAEDFDGVLKGTEATEPNVLVTDIRMPPSFQNEGIEAARLVRLKQPGDRRRGPVAVRRARVRDRAAGRRRRRLRVPLEGPRRRRRPARAGRARGRDRRQHARPGDRRGDGVAGARRRRAHRRRGPAAAVDRRGPAGQGDRGVARDPARGGQRRDRVAVLEAREGSERGTRERAAPPAAAAEGDRRPRGAGRVAQPAAARWHRREAAPRRAQHRRDRAPRRDGADVGRARLLGDRRAQRPDRAGRAAERAPGRDEPGRARQRRHRHAVRRRRGDGGVRRARTRRPTTPIARSRPR